MSEILVGVLGLVVGLNLGLLTWAWHLVKQSRALKETLEADWKLRQISDWKEAKVPKGYDTYHPSTWGAQSTSGSGAFNGSPYTDTVTSI